VSGHPGRESIVEAICQAAVKTGLATPIAGAHDHVVTCVEAIEERLDMSGIVLPIGVHEDENGTTRRASTALYCGTIAHRVRRRKYARALFGCNPGRCVSGTIVHNNQFGIGKTGFEIGQDAF
jgi:hypothetical protein